MKIGRRNGRSERGSAYVMSLLVLVLITGYAVAEMTVAIYRDRATTEACTLQDALYIAEAGLGLVQAQLLASAGDANGLKETTEAADGSPTYFPGGAGWDDADLWQGYPDAQNASGSSFRVELELIKDPNGAVANMILRSTGRVPHPFKPDAYLERTIVCLLYPNFESSSSSGGPPPYNPGNVPVGFEEPLCSTERIYLHGGGVKTWRFDSDPDPNLLDANGWHTRGGQGADPSVNWPFDYKTANNLNEEWDPYGGTQGRFGLESFCVSTDVNDPRQDPGSGFFTYYEDDPNDATDWAIYLNRDMADVRGDYFAPLGYLDTGIGDHIDTWSELYDKSTSYYPNVLDSDRRPSEDTAVGYVESLENDPNVFNFGGIYAQKDLDGDGTVDPVTEELNFTNSRALLAAAANRALNGLDENGDPYATNNTNGTLSSIQDVNTGVSILDPNGTGLLWMDRAAIEALWAAGYGDPNDPTRQAEIRLPGGVYYFDRIDMQSGETGESIITFTSDTTIYVRADDPNGVDDTMVSDLIVNVNGTTNAVIVFEGDGQILTNGELSGSDILIRTEEPDANNPTNPDLTIMANRIVTGTFGQFSAEGDLAIYAADLIEMNQNIDLVAGGNLNPSENKANGYTQADDDYEGDLLLFAREMDFVTGNGLEFWGNTVHLYAKYYSAGGGNVKISCRENPTGDAVGPDGIANNTQILIDNLFASGQTQINRGLPNGDSGKSIRMDNNNNETQPEDDMMWFPFAGRLYVNCRGSSPESAFDANDLPHSSIFYDNGVVDPNNFYPLSSTMSDVWTDDSSGGGIWGQMELSANAQLNSLIIAPGVWTQYKDSRVWGGLMVGRIRGNPNIGIEVIFDDYVRTRSRAMEETGPVETGEGGTTTTTTISSYGEEERWEQR